MVYRKVGLEGALVVAKYINGHEFVMSDMDMVMMCCIYWVR